MRTGVFSDAGVGQYLAKDYVSTWKRVSTFTVLQKDGKTVVRAGGNVAIYFCTPDYEVVNAIAGPTVKQVFLDEARWAVETYLAARERAGGNREALVRAITEEHQARVPPALPRVGWLGEPLEYLLENGGGQVLMPDENGRVVVVAVGGRGALHRYLAEKGLPKLDDIYKDVFERQLGQRVTNQPVETREWSELRPVVRILPEPSEVERLREQLRKSQETVDQLRKENAALKSREKRTY